LDYLSDRELPNVTCAGGIAGAQVLGFTVGAVLTLLADQLYTELEDARFSAALHVMSGNTIKGGVPVVDPLRPGSRDYFGVPIDSAIRRSYEVYTPFSGGPDSGVISIGRRDAPAPDPLAEFVLSNGYTVDGSTTIEEIQAALDDVERNGLTP